MLTDERIDHYRTFGYAVLRRHLRDDEADRLRREVKTAQRDAFGPRLDERSFAGGIPGHYLPMMSRQRTPINLAMIEDDRFLGAAGELVGGRVLPTYAEGILYFGSTPLHHDAGPGAQGVKFVAYLEPLTADTGALRLLAGSHHPGVTAALTGWVRRHRIHDDKTLLAQVAGLPLAVVETKPGDVVVFDWHTRHASLGGVDRLQWTVSYVKDPASPADVERFKDIVIDTGIKLDTDPDYDAGAYPHYDEHWLAPDPASPTRTALSERMRELGMFGPSDPS